MEKGKRFELVVIRRDKVDRKVPCHPHHLITSEQKTKLEALISLSTDVSKPYIVNSGGNILLLRYLMRGSTVVSWKQEGNHVKVRVTVLYFPDTFIYI